MRFQKHFNADPVTIQPLRGPRKFAEAGLFFIQVVGRTYVLRVVRTANVTLALPIKTTYHLPLPQKGTISVQFSGLKPGVPFAIIPYHDD